MREYFRLFQDEHLCKSLRTGVQDEEFFHYGAPGSHGNACHAPDILAQRRRFAPSPRGEGAALTLVRIEGPGETQFRAPRGEVFAAEAVIEAGRRELHAAGGEIAEAAFDTPSHAFRHEVIGTEHERS